jgi:hypothetical protein
MWTLGLIGLYLLYRFGHRSNPHGAGRVLPIVLESLALALLVIWRTVVAGSRMNRF